MMMNNINNPEKAAALRELLYDDKVPLEKHRFIAGVLDFYKIRNLWTERQLACIDELLEEYYDVSEIILEEEEEEEVINMMSIADFFVKNQLDDTPLKRRALVDKALKVAQGDISKVDLESRPITFDQDFLFYIYDQI